MKYKIGFIAVSFLIAALVLILVGTETDHSEGFIGNWQTSSVYGILITMSFQPGNDCKVTYFNGIELASFNGKYQVIDKQIVKVSLDSTPVSSEVISDTFRSIVNFYSVIHFEGELKYFYHLNDPNNGLAKLGELEVTKLNKH